MQTIHDVIRTTVDPKDFRAKYQRITVRDGGEFETTATTEIIDEDIDPATKDFLMRVVLYYPPEVNTQHNQPCNSGTEGRQKGCNPAA